MTAIRRATYDDAEAIAALLGELGYPAAVADATRRMRNLDKSDNAILVAEDHKKEVVGLAVLHRTNVLHAPSPVGQIIALVVTERARGKGIGRMLVSAVESLAREMGCGRLTVTSAESRDGAHEFYPAIGLPLTGRRYAKDL